MERKSIFKPCDMKYDEHDKPVRYTEEFLKEVAEHTIGSLLVEEEHLGKNIGNVTGIEFRDGELMADISTSSSLDNMGYSPSFDCTLVDNGDYWLATEGKLLEVALTSKPRQAILTNTNGGSKMSGEEDKTKEFLAKEIDRLNKEIAKKDLALERNKEKLDKYDNLEKEVEKLRDWKETNQKLIDEQKPIVEAYNAQQEKHREELLEQASQGNPQLKEQFESFSTENLETYIKLHTEEQPPKGAGANNAPGLNEGEHSEEDEKAKQEKELKAVESMFSEFNTEEE